MPIEDRPPAISLMLFDVDGVLTDGTLLLHADGTESKMFDIKDGTGIVWAQRLGLTVGFLSARSSAGDGAARGAARHHARASGRRQQARDLRSDRPTA